MKRTADNALKLEREELKRYRRYVDVLQEAQLLCSELCHLAHATELQQLTTDQRARCHEIAERLRVLRGELLEMHQ